MNLIPLRQASLCANCSTISDATGESCPACGSAGALLALSRVLGRVEGHPDGKNAAWGSLYELMTILEAGELWPKPD